MFLRVDLTCFPKSRIMAMKDKLAIEFLAALSEIEAVLTTVFFKRLSFFENSSFLYF